MNYISHDNLLYEFLYYLKTENHHLFLYFSTYSIYHCRLDCRRVNSNSFSKLNNIAISQNKNPQTRYITIIAKNHSIIISLHRYMCICNTGSTVFINTVIYSLQIYFIFCFVNYCITNPFKFFHFTSPLEHMSQLIYIAKNTILISTSSIHNKDIHLGQHALHAELNQTPPRPPP